MKIIPKPVQPDRLLLDPNNYRFHDLPGYKPTLKRQKYGDTNVQAKTLILLQSTEEFELSALKDSILTNGYVGLEQIVVEEYDRDEDGARYLVVEGNRRVAAIQILLEEHKNSLTAIPAEKLASIKKLTVAVIKGSTKESDAFKQTLMAIRHVAGIREWGPYQQAKLIAELYEKENYQFGKVAQRVGIQAREVARRYRAIKALGQMENDDEFGEFAIPKLYAFFHEAVSLPKVREWLDWSDDEFLAQNSDSRRGFYELLTSRKVDGETLPPKILDVRDVRKLKGIVDKPRPLTILLDPERTLEDAEKAAEEDGEDEPGTIEQSINQAIQALNRPNIDTWSNPSDRARELWQRLTNTVNRIQQLMGS